MHRSRDTVAPTKLGGGKGKAQWVEVPAAATLSLTLLGFRGSAESKYLTYRAASLRASDWSLCLMLCAAAVCWNYLPMGTTQKLVFILAPAVMMAYDQAPKAVEIVSCSMALFSCLHLSEREAQVSSGAEIIAVLSLFILRGLLVQVRAVRAVLMQLSSAIVYQETLMASGLSRTSATALSAGIVLMVAAYITWADYACRTEFLASMRGPVSVPTIVPAPAVGQSSIASRNAGPGARDVKDQQTAAPVKVAEACGICIEPATAASAQVAPATKRPAYCPALKSTSGSQYNANLAGVLAPTVLKSMCGPEDDCYLEWDVHAILSGRNLDLSSQDILGALTEQELAILVPALEKSNVSANSELPDDDNLVDKLSVHISGMEYAGRAPIAHVAPWVCWRGVAAPCVLAI